jgi:C4-dicarboxylate-binding protein DctP
MKLRGFLKTFAICAVALALPLTAQAAPIVIKFSHVVANDTPKGKAAEKFKQLAEKYTSGRVKVELYPNSQLYKDREEMEALQLGAVQMLAPSVSKFGPLGVREFEVFDLPYLFPDAETVDRVTDGEIGKALFARLELRGIRGLAYWDNGFKQFSANRPLREPGDFRGLKMRIQSSKVLEAMMRQLGASEDQIDRQRDRMREELAGSPLTQDLLFPLPQKPEPDATGTKAQSATE